MTTYYAIKWTYGRACNTDGESLGDYYAFSSQADRRAWIEDSRTDSYLDAGYCEAVPTSNCDLRRVLRREASEAQLGCQPYGARPYIDRSALGALDYRGQERARA